MCIAGAEAAAFDPYAGGAEQFAQGLALRTSELEDTQLRFALIRVL